MQENRSYCSIHKTVHLHLIRRKMEPECSNAGEHWPAAHEDIPEVILEAQIPF